MKHNRLAKFIKWGLCGVVISAMVNILYIISLYIDFSNICYYLIAILMAVVVWLMLNECKLKTLIIAIGIMILGNIATEILLQICKVTNYFYYSIYPDATEVALGEGIKMVFLYGFSALGILTGWVLLFITTCIKQKKRVSVKNN